MVVFLSTTYTNNYLNYIQPRKIANELEFQVVIFRFNKFNIYFFIFSLKDVHLMF